MSVPFSFFRAMTWCNITIRSKRKLLVFCILFFTWHITLVLEVTGPKRDSSGGQVKTYEGVERFPEGDGRAEKK